MFTPKRRVTVLWRAVSIKEDVKIFWFRSSPPFADLLRFPACLAPFRAIHFAFSTKFANRETATCPIIESY
jgi:hypothetical protein